MCKNFTCGDFSRNFIFHVAIQKCCGYRRLRDVGISRVGHNEGGGQCWTNICAQRLRRIVQCVMKALSLSIGGYALHYFNAEMKQLPVSEEVMMTFFVLFCIHRKGYFVRKTSTTLFKESQFNRIPKHRLSNFKKLDIFHISAKVVGTPSKSFIRKCNNDRKFR